MNGAQMNGSIENFATIFPKGTQFDQVSEANIQRATGLINNKPRKCLRWQTPVQAVSKPLSRW